MIQNLRKFLKDVADAIREKKGTTELISPSDFAEEIKGITSGGQAYTRGLYAIDFFAPGLGDGTAEVALFYYIDAPQNFTWRDIIECNGMQYLGYMYSHRSVELIINNDNSVSLIDGAGNTYPVYNNVEEGWTATFSNPVMADDIYEPKTYFYDNGAMSGGGL